MTNAFDESFDVVVVGFGYAGSIAAMEASDAGAEVLLIEKMPDPGGISACSGGAVRCAYDKNDAFAYLKATNDGTTPDDVLEVFAEGMTELKEYITDLAKVNDAETTLRDRVGNYPYPGYETFYYINIEEVPNFAGYPQVLGGSGWGGKLFKVVQDNVMERGIDVRLETPGLRLIADENRVVQGIVIGTKEGKRNIQARKGVILACGGFEADDEMKRQHWQMRTVMSAANRGNTGDGIRMAQSMGAQLWHMWHNHGTYGFRHPDPDYPYAIRMKRYPDWTPGYEDEANVEMVWIVVDQGGRRYMNECPPYVQDLGHRPMELFDPYTQSFPRIPSYFICDEEGRKRYPLGAPMYNDREATFDWSKDNLAEIDLGILKRADTIPELAAKLGLDADILAETIDRWNAVCESGKDADFGRPSGTMFPIKTPPYLAGELYPLVSNTQGGPVHDKLQRVIDVYDNPIPRLYGTGECGSIFGFLYISGGNLAECFISGKIAGRHAAALDSWD